MMSTYSVNSKINMRSSERRGTKHRSAVDVPEDDVLEDILMSKTCFLRSDNINRRKHKKLVTRPAHSVQDLEMFTE